MKIAISIFILLAAVNFSVAEKNQSDSAAASKKYKSFSRYEVFFQAGYALPVGSFGRDFEVNRGRDFKYFLQSSLEGETGGFNAQSTLTLESGVTFFFTRKIPKPNFGIRTILFSYASFPFRWEKDSDLVYNQAIYKSLRIISMRTGPIMRLYGNNNVQFDLFYQAGVAFGSHAGSNYSDKYDEFDNGLKYHISDKADFKMNGGFGLMHEAGVAISYRALKTGISFNVGTLKYNNVQYYRNIAVTVNGYYINGLPISESYALYASENLAVKAPVSYFKFFVGISFGK